jgi:hypothetical protein
MDKTIWRGGILSAGLLVFAVGGCGDKGHYTPTTGVVALDGQPVDDASIMFVSEPPAGEPPKARSKEDGTFSLVTGTAEGAPPGTYKVVVKKWDTSPNAKGKQSVLPRVYASPNTTPLRCTVPHDGPVQLKLENK